MIARLQGRLVHLNGNELVIDVGGVGYQLTATSSILSDQPVIDSELTLVVHTDVKENSISLFGFKSILEKEVFLLLQKVKGIGSRLALGIISAIGALEVLSIIGRSDVRALQQVPGVGKKTAERLIVELRENVGQLAAETSIPLVVEVNQPLILPGSGQAELVGSVEADAALALEKLGFSGDKARRAVRETVTALQDLQDPGAVDAGELLRLALARL